MFRMSSLVVNFCTIFFCTLVFLNRLKTCWEEKIPSESGLRTTWPNASRSLP